MEYRVTSFQVFEVSPIKFVSEDCPGYLYFGQDDHNKMDFLLRRARLSVVEHKFKCAQNSYEIFDIVIKRIK